jgi:Iap family predicted aminopeptidase
MDFKQCSKCGEIKSVDNFYWRKDSQEYRNECKQCRSIYGHVNLEKVRLRHKIWRKNNPDKVKKQKLAYYSKPNSVIVRKNYNSKYWKNNKEKLSLYNKEYYQINKDKITQTNNIWYKNNIEKRRQCQRERRKTNVNFRLSNNLSRSIRKSLQLGKNGRHWETVVNYSLQDLIKHLEKQFSGGMSWDNYGRKGWVVDHIIPISLWKYSTCDDREFKQCWCLANLQPLWDIDNLKKKDKII